MDILICGTAAAEGWPALFCHCEVCIQAQKSGGKDIRSRSAYMIGEAIRIDFGPDSYHHSLQHHLDYGKVRHLLVSHSHWDHWVPEELVYRRQGFSQVPESSMMTVYGNDAVHKRADAAVEGDWSRFMMNYVPIFPFEAIELEGGIIATPILAEHARQEICVNWMVEVNGRTFLQAHDTGWWTDETWEFLKGKKLNAVAMDCTFGGIDRDRGHMGCEAVARAKNRMIEEGAVAEDCRFLATHFSHNGGWLHEQLEDFFRPHNIETAYDGMRFPLNVS